MRSKILLCLSTIFYLIIFSCGTVRNATPSSIGLLSLDSYSFTAGPLSADTTYKVIRSEEEFKTMFSSTDPAARKPGFGGQVVVAIVFRNSVVDALQFQRADVTGNTVNIYAVTCSGPNCQPNQAMLATIPKVGDATKARFVINGQEKAVIGL